VFPTAGQLCEIGAGHTPAKYHAVVTHHIPSFAKLKCANGVDGKSADPGRTPGKPFTYNYLPKKAAALGIRSPVAFDFALT